ncbi:MAG: hypothetical protein HMLKMBBP_01755 [Planctomycetes bacterium]|nr:hypothetical protein [Planctomycetota bacterium]
MEQAGQAGRSGSPRDAQAKRREAQKQLEEAREALRDPGGDAAARERLRRLKDEQEKIRSEAEKLAEELAKKESTQTGADGMRRAAERMRQASRDFEEGDSEEGAEEARQAEKYLDMADRNLEDEERQYQNLEAQEALYKIEQELARVEREERAILEKTTAAWNGRSPEGGFTRFQRIEMKNLAEEQRSLATSLDPVVKAVAEEGSVVYAPIMRAVADDMRSAAERIQRYEPDELCRVTQQGVIDRLVELQDVFREHRKSMAEQAAKPQEGQQGGGEGQQGGGGSPIVAKVAEIRALKRMQEAVSRELAALEQEGISAENASKLTHVQRFRIERLAHQQGSVRQMWRDLATGLGVDPAKFDAPAEGEDRTDEGDPHGGTKENGR